jgi:hypothetical protein
MADIIQRDAKLQGDKLALLNQYSCGRVRNRRDCESVLEVPAVGDLGEKQRKFREEMSSI